MVGSHTKKFNSLAFELARPADGFLSLGRPGLVLVLDPGYKASCLKRFVLENIPGLRL